ncbi:MAG: serine/threonine-protein kinase [bacterium]
MSSQLSPGTKVDRYGIRSQLGVGGMGEVYLAEDIKLGRKVTLKFLSYNLTRDEERVRRFSQKARAASALNHPTILTIYEIGEADGRRFIAIEFVEGQTLRQRIVGGVLETIEAVSIAEHIASALHAAHAAGIVHRDIKPENIMLRWPGLPANRAKATKRPPNFRKSLITVAGTLFQLFTHSLIWDWRGPLNSLETKFAAASRIRISSPSGKMQMLICQS